MKLSAAVSFVVALASVAPALAVGVWQQCDVRVIEYWINGILSMLTERDFFRVLTTPVARSATLEPRVST